MSLLLNTKKSIHASWWEIEAKLEWNFAGNRTARNITAGFDPFVYPGHPISNGLPLFSIVD